jgi:hypothetical protein
MKPAVSHRRELTTRPRLLTIDYSLDEFPVFGDGIAIEFPRLEGNVSAVPDLQRRHRGSARALRYYGRWRFGSHPNGYFARAHSA